MDFELTDTQVEVLTIMDAEVNGIANQILVDPQRENDYQRMEEVRQVFELANICQTQSLRCMKL